ncbi:hypothetical protein [uncultured Psychromonas sp.]|uniref:hypothetical protein n=1 Tax=uncultured Psychromonas sp. TaxID=173974 RepID=UPI00262996F8|nr:hypothetical protein [uncultured Psychromonas sp.]
MLYIYLVLLAEFKAILSASKTMTNRDVRFDEFREAVKKTLREEGDIAQLTEIQERFTIRLQKTNSWGRKLVRKELEIVLKELSSKK